MRTYKRTKLNLIIRDNGKFAKVDWEDPETKALYAATDAGDEWTEEDIPEILGNVSTTSEHGCCGKCHSETGSKFTVQFKATAYYDIEIFAESFEEAFEKAKNIPAYDIVTEGELVDIETPVSVDAVLKQS